MRYAMKRGWLLLPVLLFSVTAFADAGDFAQGASYVAVDPAQATDVKPGQVEVIEFYWYGCPHCFALEPYVEAWEKGRIPKYVTFKRVPASIPDSEFYVDAQATFTAEVLGIGEKIREPFFNAIHLDGQDALRADKDAIRDFFGKYGVKPADFDATWASFGVQSRLAAAQQLGERYQMQSVPTIIVNGRWKTGAGYRLATGNYMTEEQVMQCVEFLIEKEHKTAR